MRKYIQGVFRQFCFLMIAPLLIAISGPSAFAQLSKVGRGEGRVDIVALPGYIERGETMKEFDWVTKFEKTTGCMVKFKTPNRSDEMVALMN